ncbi:MAG: CHASE3 domain-containing protein, partial [Novosphingobium sp.]|nr:CHASE3 domain-containing protein [Novosphingobium sp.]
LDKRYLAPYAAALAQHEPSIARLRALTAGSPDPRQRELAAAVAQLSDAKFAEVGEVIAQIQKGDLFGAQRRILSDEGQDVMERLRRAIAGMEAIEQDSLTAAHDRAVATEARMVPLMLVLLVLISTTLGLGLWLVVRNADAEALAAHAGQLAAARDRADLLANELNHRVKNLFAVVRATAPKRSRRSSGSPTGCGRCSRPTP